MKPALPILLLMSQGLLSGCAASLVYDRDRPAGDCRDQQQRCLHSTVPGGAMYPDVLQPTAKPAGSRLAWVVPDNQV